MHFYDKTWEEKAFDLADQGISLGALEQLKASAFCWAAAAELATQHLRENDIYYWIMGGVWKGITGM